MSTDLSDQIHELMERGVRPVSMADIESRAPARGTALRTTAYRSAGPGRGLTRWLRWPQLAVGAAAAGTAAAGTVAGAPGGPPDQAGGPGRFPAAAHPPAPA